MKAPSSPPDLVHASHIRLAYRAMLGREATPAEVQVQLAGLRTTAELLSVLAESAEFTGSAQVLLDPRPGPSRANIWHPDLAPWTYQPGTTSSDDVVVVGEDGWLFIQGGTNSNVAQHTGELVMSPGWATAWSNLVEARQAEAREAGLTTASLIVPDKLAVQVEHYPHALESAGPRPAMRLVEELGLPIVYPLDALRAARTEGDVYLKTDSHYALRGNFIVHQALCEALGVSPLPASALGGAQAYVASGDLGARFDPPVVEVMRSMLSLGDATITEDNRDAVAATGGHIGSRRVFSNPGAADPRTAVIFGDSYGFASEGYQGVSWFLAQLFHEVHFVWTPFGWDAGYARRVGAEVVVSQTAERFVSRVPAVRVDAAALVAQAVGRTGAVNPDLVFDNQA